MKNATQVTSFKIGENASTLEPSLPDFNFARWIERTQKLWLVVALLAAIFWTVLLFQFTIDDAYISFRYGHVLAGFHTWNWNPGGARVEAYTSATYTILSILPALLHMSLALFFKFVGIACVGAMTYRVWTRSRSRFAAILGVLLLGLNPWVWVHAYAGLETPLYMLLILEIAICAMDAPKKASPYIYFVGLLLPMTRPEGIVFAVVGIAVFWYRRGSQPKHLSGLVAAVGVGLVYFIARWRYFHHLLPNPFYVKVAHATLHQMLESLSSNLSWEKGFLLSTVLVVFFARTLTARAFASTTLALMLLLFAPHDMMMNYSDRFYFQMALPMMLIFLVSEDIVALSRISSVLVSVLLLAITAKDLKTSLSYFPDLEHAHVDLGRRLAPYASNHSLLIGDAGAIPYYSNWLSYDYLGLCTDSIAQQGISLPLFQKLHPDLIIVYSGDPSSNLLKSPADGTSEGVVLEYIRQNSVYEYVGASRWGQEYLVEFLRKDTPDREAIKRSLAENTESSARFHLSMKSLLLQHYVPWHD